MNTFESYVQQSKVSADSLRQACRLLVAEESEDLGPDAMHGQIVARVGDAAAVDKVLGELAQDTTSLDAAAFDYLREVWTEPGGEQRVRTAIAAADRTLPVIEIGVVAITVMYIAYLHYTRGVESEKRETTTKKDGTKTELYQRKFYSPTGPLMAVVHLFKGTSPRSKLTDE